MAIFFNEKDIEEIEKTLENIPHDEEAIRLALKPYSIDNYFRGITLDELVGAMF